MTEARAAWYARPPARTAAVLALLAYLPSLTAAPGRMPSDSKLYLYLDPGRFLADAASTFDGRQFAGWVPHQHVAYLWPSGPWFWFFETIGVPDWIAHRLWIGSIMLAAGLGVRWCGRLLGVGPMAAFAAAIAYQLSVYVLPYVSRTSVMLLPWAGLGWIVAFTIRATRQRGWADPAAVALVVLTVGAVNATALAMIIPAPAWWLVHAAWRRSIAWRDAALVATRVGVLSLAVSLWWIAMLLIQGRYGTDVLPYSESLADVSLTATSAETWRGLGYWLFYVRDPFSATTTESLRYLSSTVSIALSYALPLLALAALTWCRWAHRRYVAGLIGIGLVLAVGVHPIGDRSPLMRVFAGDDDGGLALALRSSTRALPVMMLGVALALAMVVEAGRTSTPVPRFDLRASSALGVTVALVAVLNLPSLWTGAFVDPALERDQDPPPSWLEAAAALDASGDDGRVLQLPGVEFGAYRWGYTVDQPLPGLTDKPLVTRDLLPLGSGPAMDLLYAFDDRVQDGVLEPSAVAPIARLLGADTIWLTNDLAAERFRTARPGVVRDLVTGAPGIGDPVGYGELSLHRPETPMADGRALADARVGDPSPDVELVAVEQPGRVVRAAADVLVVSGSGDGLVDAAGAGLLDGTDVAIRYSADLDAGRDGAVERAVGVIVTDSNRDRARHWRSSQDTTGFTETGGPDQDVLTSVAADARLDVFHPTDPATQTIAEQRGPVVATASAYGEPFAYLPEHRPFMAVDGDPDTAWLVGEHGDPIGATIRLDFERPTDRLVLHQPPQPDDRHITQVVYRTAGGADGGSGGGSFTLDEASWNGAGNVLQLDAPVDAIDLTIVAVAGGTPFTASAVAPVGFTEIDTGAGPATEVVRPPIDALGAVAAETPLAHVLTRLRVDPMDRWRDDPEPVLVREIELPTPRDMTVELSARIDARATDAELASLFGWPAVASTRLTGSPRNAGVSALDDDDTTAWITAFGAARGAVLATTTSEPVSSVTVRQPVSGFSRVTSLVIRAGDEERTVQLDPDAAGSSTVPVDPPLPAGALEFVLAEIDEEQTIDRRFGDPLVLPAAILDLRYDGRPATEPVAASSVDVPCATVARIDGVDLTASIRVVDAGWLDGAPIEVEACDPSVSLAAGHHLIEGTAGALPVTLDRVVLDDGVASALRDAAPAPPVEVVADGRFDRTVEVGPCPDGCWLVIGEGVNEAWTATAAGLDLGPPVTVDGGFNGWWVAPRDGITTVEVRWTAQGTLVWALVVSLLGTAGAIALIARARLRRDDDIGIPDTATPPGWSWGPSAPVARHRAVMIAATWTLAGGLLIGPQWALCGLVGGAAVVIVRRHRLVELTALASLLVVAAIVVLRERRSAPPPNGAWPGTFESVHGLGMFAIACVIVAALVADDTEPAAAPPGRPDNTTDG
ncbi:MAG: alpha-(1-_3)-arabinofuranosyltransferase family protein [Ilumatobacteraceae bacterium]|nr:alpha-(1->3)-arabinofuranosyltransferase family protein [Ilumatobacteraceae bacterium]